MAARPARLTAAVLGVALTVWVWSLAGFLFVLRWNSVERPGPPVRELFPYGEMRVGVDASLPPFAVATSDDLYGLEIDLARTLGQRLGISVRFVNLGYDGLYDSLQADVVDVLISQVIIDPAHTQDVRYTVPYFNAGLVLVSKAASPFTSMDSMPGNRLALEYGSPADAEARHWTRRLDPFAVRPYELPEYALDAVRLGDADAALVDATSARLYLRQHTDWPAQLSYVTDALYAAAVRYDRVETWAAIDKALRSLIADGTLDQIVNTWL